MINHPFDRSPGLANPDFQVGKVFFGPTFRPDVMQPNPFPFGTRHIPAPTREEIMEALNTYILPQLADQIEGAANDTQETEETPQVDVTGLYEAACACDDFDDEPVVFLTVDEALFVHEVLQAAFMGALIDLSDSPSQLITLGLQGLRARIDEVQSVIEEQLEAAEAF